MALRSTICEWPVEPVKQVEDGVLVEGYGPEANGRRILGPAADWEPAIRLPHDQLTRSCPLLALNHRDVIEEPTGAVGADACRHPGGVGIEGVI